MAGARRAGLVRWRGSWPPVARRAASSACRPPTPRASRGHAPRRASSRPAARRAAPGDGSPRPCARPGVVGQPRQRGVGAEHAHPLRDGVVGSVGVVQAEHDHLVTLSRAARSRVPPRVPRSRRRPAAGTPTTASTRARMERSSASPGRAGRACRNLWPCSCRTSICSSSVKGRTAACGSSSAPTSSPTAVCGSPSGPPTRPRCTRSATGTGGATAPRSHRRARRVSGPGCAPTPPRGTATSSPSSTMPATPR